jgi:hypothetical protein
VSRDVGEDFGGVAFGFDVVPGLLDFAVGADEIRAAGDTLVGAAHEFLEAPSSVRLNHFVRGIAEQREIELLFGLEAGEELRSIGAGAEDDHSGFIELQACVAKLGRFDGSTGSVGLRKEEDEDALALKVVERDFLVFIGLQCEVGSFCAWFEHPSPQITPPVRRRRPV